MSSTEWIAVLVGVGVVLVVLQLHGANARLARVLMTLQSLDTELFHLAQEQNPAYGLCDQCGPPYGGTARCAEGRQRR